VIVDHTTDNVLMKLRFTHAKVRMQAAEEDFEAGGRKFRAGAFVIAGADRAAIEPTMKELGIAGFAVAAAPTVAMHDLDVPRIGYVHSWANTQNEGWVRAALDTYAVPYTYFADIKLRDGNLRQKYDVIVFPHVGGSAQSQVAGIPKTGTQPLPYKKSADTPNLGAQDQAEDIRGGMGWEGLMELVKFVRGSILRGVFADRRSPIAYGYDAQVPVYFSQSPVLNAGGAGGGGFGGRGGRGDLPGVGMNTTPMATAPQQRLSTWDPDGTAPPAAPSGRGGRGGGEGQGGFGGRGGRGGGGGFGAFGGASENQPRVVLAFPPNADDMLLSGVLVGGQSLANRAQVVDAPVGQGHVVMFAIRPFWRWQTQGTFFRGFNAILHWNDLDAGRAGARRPTAAQ
jgi:hypothetical protein